MSTTLMPGRNDFNVFNAASRLAPLARYQGLVLRQRVEALELVGCETPNAYDLYSFDGQRVLYAREREGGFWNQVGRQMGGHTLNDFVIDVVDNAGNVLLTLSHPAAWLRQRILVHSGSGRLLGTFEECFSFNKKLVVKSADGHARMAMEARLLSPWDYTFTRVAPRTPKRIAHVQKHWDGFGRELFTDADTFRLVYESRSLDLDERALLLAAMLFIDLVWFETKASHSLVEEHVTSPLIDRLFDRV